MKYSPHLQTVAAHKRVPAMVSADDWLTLSIVSVIYLNGYFRSTLAVLRSFAHERAHPGKQAKIKQSNLDFIHGHFQLCCHNGYILILPLMFYLSREVPPASETVVITHKAPHFRWRTSRLGG